MAISVELSMTSLVILPTILSRFWLRVFGTVLTLSTLRNHSADHVDLNCFLYHRCFVSRNDIGEKVDRLRSREEAIFLLRSLPDHILRKEYGMHPDTLVCRLNLSA